MGFLLSKWLQAVNRRVSRGAGNLRRVKRTVPTRFVPRLEALEDRTVPSTLTVTSAADSGAGSLRAEITAAHSGDTITFDNRLRGQTITLTSGELVLNKSLNIEGLGANQLTVSGNNNSRVFDITAGTASVTIAGLTLTKGQAGYGYGGGIYNAGTLIINNCALAGNNCYGGIGDGGGAIFNGGGLTINNSTLSGNQVQIGGVGSDAYGGAIYSYGRLSINSSTISGNGVFGGSSSVGGTTPNGTSPGTGAGAGQGGGLYVAGGAVTIDHSTIADNGAYGGPSDFGRWGSGAGGGIYNAAGADALQMHDTIVSDNTAVVGSALDLSGSITSQGHNLIGNAMGGSGFVASDLLNVNPLLGPLQNNGGPTQTMALLAGSPAINGGDPADNTSPSTPAYDQRGAGYTRIVGGRIDIGAFEVQSGHVTQPSNLAVVTLPTVLPTGSAGRFTVTSHNADGSTAIGSDASLAAAGTASSTPPSPAPEDVPRGDPLLVAGLDDGTSFLVPRAKDHLWRVGADNEAETGG